MLSFCQSEKGAVGVEEEKERGCGLSNGYSPGPWGVPLKTLVPLKTRDCKRFALEIT